MLLKDFETGSMGSAPAQSLTDSTDAGKRINCLAMHHRRLKILFAFPLIAYAALAPASGVVAQGRAPSYATESATGTATISVNASQMIRTVDRRMFGINTAIWDSVFDSVATRSRLQEMSVQALRYPALLRASFGPKP